MAEMNIKLRGWQAAVALVAIVVLVGVRMVTFRDKTDDPKLIQSLETQLASDYLPEEAARLDAAVASGDEKAISAVAESIARAKPNIRSVQISSPLLDFSSPRDVVVKVEYALEDENESRNAKTLYFLYTYSAPGNTWRYRHKSSKLSYYLNFK